jgi:hypothetical protein
MPGKALYQDLGMLINQYAHVKKISCQN